MRRPFRPVRSALLLATLDLKVIDIGGTTLDTLVLPARKR
jgi:hypothetical protein